MQPVEFYSIPWVANALVEQFRFRYMTLRFAHGLQRHYKESHLADLVQCQTKLWRPEANPFLEIHRVLGPDDPTSLEYFVRKGVIEWIPEVSTVFDLERAPVICIDLDPKYKCDDAHLVQTTKVVATSLGRGSALDKTWGVRAMKFRFSGNRSMHIWIGLNKPSPLAEVRESVKTSLDVICKRMYRKQLSYENRPDEDYILIDLGAMARHRCVRSLWSLHHKTGLVCIPVLDLDQFHRDQAKPENVRQVAEVF